VAVAWAAGKGIQVMTVKAGATRADGTTPIMVASIMVIPKETILASLGQHRHLPRRQRLHLLRSPRAILRWRQWQQPAKRRLADLRQWRRA
jgi:hypothetical protein